MNRDRKTTVYSPFYSPEFSHTVRRFVRTYSERQADEIAFDEEDHPNGIHPGQLDFTDFFDVDVTEYTGRYIWCCRAIVWAIQQYDQLKKEQEAA